MELHPHEHVAIGCFRGLVLMSIGIVLVGSAALFFAWRYTTPHDPLPGYNGTPQRGRILIARYGCASCHLIPGAATQGLVGPPLSHFGSRSYIAGVFPNQPIDLQQWLQHPQSMKPGTGMPDLGMSDRDARDVAAYLATLK